MAVEEHPHFEAWRDAYRDFIAALERLNSEIKKGDRGLIDAAKLDLQRATEKYDAIRDRL